MVGSKIIEVNLFHIKLPCLDHLMYVWLRCIKLPIKMIVEIVLLSSWNYHSVHKPIKLKKKIKRKIAGKVNIIF